jgi:glycosyltransferase involved in cell wall biosynthesis
MITWTSRGVNPLHRAALTQAVNNLNAGMATSGDDREVIILVSTKNIVRNILTAIFSNNFVILYFTGYGRLFLDYGFIGKWAFIVVVLLCGIRKKRQFIVENRYDCAFIQKWTRREISRINGSGFDKTLYKTRQKGKATKKKHHIIGHMSRFGRSKCTGEIIKMIERLPPDCRMIIAGKDIRGSRYTGKFYDIAGSKPNVEMIGFLETPEEVSSFFSKIDVFLYPSVREGLPISLLESVYYRVPFLTTNVAGCIDLAEAFGFPACAPENFGKQDNHKIKYVESWGAYSKHWDDILKKYSTETVQAQFEKIFSKILKMH